MEFQSRIRDLRKEKGLSGDELGQMVGLSRFAVSGWENGKAYPSVEVCLQLCKIFGCSMDYLLGLSDSLDEKSTDELCERIKALDPEQRKEILNYLDFLEFKSKKEK